MILRGGKNLVSTSSCVARGGTAEDDPFSSGGRLSRGSESRRAVQRPELAEGDMRLRSLLFVPGDSQRKFARAKDCGADALILDLEDSVAGPEKAAARSHVAGLIEPDAKRPWTFIVRINALDTGLALADLEAVVKPGLDALLIPKV